MSVPEWLVQRGKVEMSMPKQDESVVRVCGEEEVPSLCQQGFRLKEIIYTDRLEFATESVPRRDPNAYYNVSADVTTKQIVLRVPRFVMVQSGDDALAQKQGVIDVLDKQLREAGECTKKAVNELSGQKARADRFERELETGRAAAGRAAAREVELSAANRKLEGDMGKIRSAIGEIRMKEIIG